MRQTLKNACGSISEIGSSEDISSEDNSRWGDALLTLYALRRSWSLNSMGDSISTRQATIQDETHGCKAKAFAFCASGTMQR